MNRKNVEDLYPLSPLQQGMLFQTLYAPEGGAYSEQIVRALHGEVDVDAMRRAWESLAARHAILRTGFVWEGVPQPLQVVFREVTLPFVYEDWSALPAEEAIARFREAVAADAARGWEMGLPPLLRVLLARVASDEYRMLISFHHVLLDGWSLPIVFGEQHALYVAEATGRPVQLPARRPFRDYIAWLTKQDAGAAERFWRARLAGFEEATALPLDRDPARTGKPVEHYVQETVVLPRELGAALGEAARRYRVTMNTLVQAAFGVLLARYAGSRDVVFGAVVSGRPPEITGVDEMVGMFINTVPARIPVPDSTPVADWLRGLQAREAEARTFEHAPLVEVRRWSEVDPERPLFQALMAFENYPLDTAITADRSPDADRAPSGDRPTASSNGGAGEGDRRPTLTVGMANDGRAAERTSFPLSVAIAPLRAGGVRLTATADAVRLDAERVRTLLEGLGVVLEQLASGSARTVGELTPMTVQQRRLVTEAWNAAAAEYPRDTPVHRLFEAQAARSPDAVAVEYGETKLTYRQLNARANRLARLLGSLGVGPETRVGVAIDRSPELVITELAVLKAGGAYVPLDPAYPAERLLFMRRDAGVTVMVIDTGEPPLDAEAEGLCVVSLAGDREAIDSMPAGDLPGPDAGPEALAYMMYTSGSTGTPKGIGIPHRAIVRLVLGTDYVQLTPADRVGQAATTAFDAATFEIWGALLNGATVVGLERDVVLDPRALPAALRDRGVTALFLTTSLFNQVAREEPDGFRTVTHFLSGGEANDPAAVRAVLEAGPPKRLMNAYGPTESTTFATWHLIESVDEDAATVPIGRPIANTTAYVLDAALRPVPVGAPGELCLGGDGLAHGYLGRPGLTAQQFVPSPFGDGARLYRTGDKARWNARGEIEFLGRLDRQVKIRGFRIEPEEVEAALLALPAVRAGVVTVREDEPGWKRLVAYAVPREGASPTPPELREALARTLPEFMVPAAFVVMDALPLNANGKVDRATLPTPEGGASEADFVEPRGAVEEALAAMWREVLRVEKVGRNDSFFERGGHSLMATQIVTRVRDAFAVDLPLRAIFDAPRLWELAERVEELRQAGTRAEVPLVAVRRGGDLPASFEQERAWLLHEIDPSSPADNLSAVVRLEGAPDVPALRRALTEVVRRHEPLRTAFAVADGRPVQRVLPAAPVPLAIDDLSAVDGDRDAEALRRAAELAAAPFDLAAGPLFRATLLKLDGQRHLLVLAFHRTAGDEGSVEILRRELETLYAAFSRGQRSTLGELPVQYAEFAAWQRESLSGERGAERLAFWTGQMADVPPALDLPADFPRPAVRDGRTETASVIVDPTTAERLRAVAAERETTPGTVLLAAYALVLGRLAGEEDVVVGAPFPGRTRTETEPMVGLFGSTLPLRIRLSGDPSFADLVARVRETADGAAAHQDVPFARLVEELRPERSLARSPVFQATFDASTLAAGPAAEPAGGLRFEVAEARAAGSRMDLALSAREAADGLALRASYDPALFSAATVEGWLREMERVLRAALENPAAAASAIAPATAAPRPRPEPAAAAETQFVAPRTPIEEVVASVFAELLGVEKVGAMDDFFALGGHSFRATVLLGRVQQTLDVQLPLRAVFESPTVAGIAASVEKAGGGEIARMLDELEGLTDEEIEALLAAEADEG